MAADSFLTLHSSAIDLRSRGGCNHSGVRVQRLIKR
jgi:hypothetical protein